MISICKMYVQSLSQLVCYINKMLKIKTININADYGTIFATVCRNQMFLKGVVFLIFILNASMNLVIIASPGYNS